MGLIGGLFLLGGLGALLMGVIGFVISVVSLDWVSALYCLGLAVGGLISGGIAAAILE